MSLDPSRYDELAEAGSLYLRAIPGAVILDLERRTDTMILRHMFLEMSVEAALHVQAKLAEAILRAMSEAAEERHLYRPKPTQGPK